MRLRRLWSCFLVSILFLPVIVQAQPQEMTVAQAEEQVRQIRATLHKDRSAPPEAWGSLMMAETILLSLRTRQSGAPVDAAALQEQQRALRDRIFAEWKEARPDEATPYLAEMQGSVPPEKMDDAVLGLVPRFPDDPRLLARAAQILARREQAQSAAELLDAALARHPERSELYGVTIGFYRGLNNETRRREVAEAWIEHQPGNPDALRNWLNDELMRPASARDPRDAAGRVERFVSSPASPGAEAKRVDACAWLLTVGEGAFKDAAMRCLSAVAEQAQDGDLRKRAATLLAGAGGDDRELAQSLAAMPAPRRRETVLGMVYGLNDTNAANTTAQCARKMNLLHLVPWDGTEAGGRFSAYFGALHDCANVPEIRTAFFNALTRAPADDLDNLFGRWLLNVNGRYLDDAGLAPRVVAILEDRLRRERGQVEIWRTLEKAYQAADRDEARAAHLTAWLGSGLPVQPNREDLVWLGAFRVGQSGPQAGIDALRLAWRKTHDTDVASALAELLLASGRMNDFEALVTELAAAGSSPEAAASPQSAAAAEANLAILLRARAALLRQGPQAALADFQTYVDRAPYLKKSEAEEYLLVVGGVHGERAAAEAAQTLCGKESLRSTVTPAQCAADLLAGIGHDQGALQLLEAAAQRAPGDPRAQTSLALAAEQAGDFDRAEQAYRRMLAIDPKSEAAWNGLGRLAERRGDAAALESLLRQAERALGEEPAFLVLALAHVDLAQGKAARAIERLDALRERRPGTLIGEVELRDAYAALGKQPPPLARAAAPIAGNAAPPPAEDLRAEREAEAALLGLGGTVDEAKGRDLVQALAQRGNAYANLRLAIWQDAGTLGFTADPRRSAATAAPHLAAVHAAAEAGEPFAQYLWGTMLLRGIGTPKQAAEAGVWLRKAAEHGEPWALHNMGWMAEQGDGMPRDLAAAVRWYEGGAAAGNPRSMLSLATLELDEGADPAERRPAEGRQWLAKAAERGLPQAVSWYAALQLYGMDGVPADPAHARPWLEKAVALGETRSLFDLGADLLTGAGGPVDERRGVALLEQAAEHGSARAMMQLAWQSALGRGTPHDAKRGAQWLARAAALGSDQLAFVFGAAEDSKPTAQHAFARDLRQLEQLAAGGDAFAGGLAARLYLEGAGVEPDPARALALAKPAAEHGSTEAMRVLGWIYKQGGVVDLDLAQAAVWWRRGAEGGNSFCMMWYSQMLFQGEASAPDPVTALAWLERSGESGNYWAVRDLGHLYDEGWHDIPRDEKRAAFWKRKALVFGDEEARGWLIAHHLTP